MITPYDTMTTLALLAHRDQVDAEFKEKKADLRYTREVVISLREDLIVIDYELEKRKIRGR